MQKEVGGQKPIAQMKFTQLFHKTGIFFFLLCFLSHSFFSLFLLLFNYSCPHIAHTTCTLLTHLNLPHSMLTFGWLSQWLLYTCHLMTHPLLSSVILLPLPSDYCQFVVYFHVFGSILLACLFCGYVPFIGEIIWYLFFTAWLFHLIQYSPVPSVLLQKIAAPSFFLLHTILLCKCTTVF